MFEKKSICCAHCGKAGIVKTAVRHFQIGVLKDGSSSRTVTVPHRCILLSPSITVSSAVNQHRAVLQSVLAKDVH